MRLLDKVLYEIMKSTECPFFSHSIHSFIQTCNLFPSVFLSKHIKNHCDTAILSHYVMWSTDRVSKFVSQNLFNKALFYVTKIETIIDQGFYKICWKSLSKTMISTMNPIDKELRNFLLISLFSTICFSKTLVVIICWI